MKTILQEQRRSSVIVALITMVLGAVLVVWPDRSVRLMCTLLGAALLICGLVYILGWLVRRREGGISAFTPDPRRGALRPGDLADDQLRLGDRPGAVCVRRCGHLPRRAGCPELGLPDAPGSGRDLNGDIIETRGRDLDE